MIWIALTVSITYVILILLFFIGWERLHEFSPEIQVQAVKISVVIAMRNEEKHIVQLINDLSNQTYPSGEIEIILVDDHSDDKSIASVKELNIESVQLYSLPDHLTGKKSALHYGIEKSKGELIALTDADCRVLPTWLCTISAYYHKFHPALLLAPVMTKPVTFFDDCQGLELLSLQGSTAGSAGIGFPIMSNGANLIFQRKIWDRVQHLYLNSKIKSGDDMFLLHKIKKTDSELVHFLKSKEAIVFTTPSFSIRDFFNQRKRWAAKARFYTDRDTIASACIVFGINACIFFCIIYGIIFHSFTPLIITFLSKSVIDFFFLYRVAAFFNLTRLIKWFPIVQSFYFLYICLTVVLSGFGTINWKSRKINY